MMRHLGKIKLSILFAFILTFGAIGCSSDLERQTIETWDDSIKRMRIALKKGVTKNDIELQKKYILVYSNNHLVNCEEGKFSHDGEIGDKEIQACKEYANSLKKRDLKKLKDNPKKYFKGEIRNWNLNS